MLQWLKRFFKKEKKKDILFFSEKALQFLIEHLKTLPQESGLVFQVIRDKKGKGLVQVGFDKLESNHPKDYQDGIPIHFRKNSKEILEGCGVDLDAKGNFLVYPRIDLNVKLSPNAHILIFESNKKILSEESELRYGAWERSEDVQKPLLIDSLFKIKAIESIYIESYKIQIELNKSKSWSIFEEKVSECILNYLESLPRPLRINSKVS
ncbi:MAG: NifU N-terminal domain-containing protein [Leptospiraceae bacterium]|nr:NifU N-terminal domain-containing protein [Leptospiraceae bacterium]